MYFGQSQVPKCGEAEAPHTLDHRLDCSGTLQARVIVFGTSQPLPLSILSSFPGKSAALPRRAL